MQSTMRQLSLLLLLSFTVQCLCIESPILDSILAEIDDLKAKAVKSDQRQRELEREITRLNEKITAIDSTTFISAHFAEDASVAHGAILTFNNVTVNYGDDYIQSGGLYLSVQNYYMLFIDWNSIRQNQILDFFSSNLSINIFTT